jgi:Flp pilus assembly protein TadG
LGTRTWSVSNELRRRREDEHGAEMVEFAFVVVLLIALLYGIISYGLILAAQSTITQAAADGARAGIVASSTAPATAEAQACTDVGWMNKSCAAPSSGSNTVCPSAVAGSAITASACEEACPSNANNECLTVKVIYNYNSYPLFPELPGMGVITPSTITSSNTLQMSTPSS